MCILIIIRSLPDSNTQVRIADERPHMADTIQKVGPGCYLVRYLGAARLKTLNRILINVIIYLVIVNSLEPMQLS